MLDFLDLLHSVLASGTDKITIVKLLMKSYMSNENNKQHNSKSTFDNLNDIFYYAILLSIPNKLGGVIALVLPIAILFILPFTTVLNKFQCNQFYTRIYY